jgi:hypothetical protein
MYRGKLSPNLKKVYGAQESIPGHLKLLQNWALTPENKYSHSVVCVASKENLKPLLITIFELICRGVREDLKGTVQRDGSSRN